MYQPVSLFILAETAGSIPETFQVDIEDMTFMVAGKW
jgi:hypothetical protein